MRCAPERCASPLPTLDTLKWSTLAVAELLTTLSMFYPRSAHGGEEGPSRASGKALSTVASRRWKDEEVARTELAERMLVALLTIASSNDGTNGEVAVGVDLQLVMFLAHSFRITSSGTDEVGGGDATSIETYAIQHLLSLIDGGNGSASLKRVVFGDGRTANIFQKGQIYSINYEYSVELTNSKTRLQRDGS